MIATICIGGIVLSGLTIWLMAPIPSPKGTGFVNDGEPNDSYIPAQSKPYPEQKRLKWNKIAGKRG